MKIYVESNFVIEMAVGQEEASFCDSLLKMSAEGLLELSIPAFSILEPYQTLERRRRDRAELHRRLQAELDQIARAAELSSDVAALRGALGIIVSSADHDIEAIEDLRKRITRQLDVIPLDAAVLRGASQLQADFGLSAPDAVVAASVLADLALHRDERAYFVTRNSKDFGDPDVMALFKASGCTVLFSFDTAVQIAQTLTD